MKKKACLICGKEKNGIDIEEDYVIGAMRWVKRNITKNEKGYRIVVCKDCMENYKKLRAKHIRRRAIYVAVGIIFTVFLTFGSRWNPIAIIYGLGMTLFLYLLSLVSYVPAIKGDKNKAWVRDTKR